MIFLSTEVKCRSVLMETLGFLGLCDQADKKWFVAEDSKDSREYCDFIRRVVDYFLACSHRARNQEQSSEMIRFMEEVLIPNHRKQKNCDPAEFFEENYLKQLGVDLKSVPDSKDSNFSFTKLVADL